MTDRRLRAPLIATLCAAATFALVGCGDGLDLDAGSLPGPLLQLDMSTRTCAAAGSGSILFDLGGTSVAQEVRSDRPVNRVTIEGTLSGVPDGDGLFLVLLPDSVNCPLVSVTPIEVTDGSFTAVGDIAMSRAGGGPVAV